MYAKLSKNSIHFVKTAVFLIDYEAFKNRTLKASPDHLGPNNLKEENDPRINLTSNGGDIDNINNRFAAYYRT